MSDKVAITGDTFKHYCSILRSELSYVEDATFSWDKVVAFLIIQLKNTDSINKERSVSNSTQIQLTSQHEVTEEARITEDFFPTLTMNSTFKRWRISIPARINMHNVEQLSGSPIGVSESWKPDSIQLRRRVLNDVENPELQICYEKDLYPLRKQLYVNDYLIITKQYKKSSYEAFGLKNTVDLGKGKRMYLSDNAKSDDTSFDLDSLINNYDNAKRIDGGTNILLYGVPGSGKSWTIEHEYCKKESKVERVVFHPDYTYSDFVGQILPVVSEDKKVSYDFTPGPFTNILRDSYRDPMTEYILIIEEINRGNAPAIFGDVFQLLDRKIKTDDKNDDQLAVGTSEYGILNNNIAEKVYGDPNHEVRIPSNLSIIATMNTSDQNVFTLDTAFQRRWNMRMIENTFENVRDSLANAEILDTNVTWEKFCTTVNRKVVGNKARMASAEDKRLGVYFVNENDLQYDDLEKKAKELFSDKDLHDEYNNLLNKEQNGSINGDQELRLNAARKVLEKNRKFPEKVIKYLWDDAFKFNPQELFDTKRFDNLDDVIHWFIFSNGQDRFAIFNETVQEMLCSK